MWKCTSMRYGLPNLILLLYLLLKPDIPYPKSCTSVASYCEADCGFLLPAGGSAGAKL